MDPLDIIINLNKQSNARLDQVEQMLDDMPDCTHENLRYFKATIYQPTQQELDEGTDHDVEIDVIQCVDCSQEIEE